jgi:hypothetical protein
VSAPLRPLQVIAPGFLGALQLKNSGTNPDQVQGELQPTIEMRDWLLQANRRSAGPYTTTLVNNQIGFQGFGTPAQLVVPNNMWWFVHQFTTYVALPLGTDSAQFWPAIAFPNAGQLIVVGRSSTETVVAGPNRQIYGFADPPFWAPPGTLFGVACGQVTTVSPTLAASAIVTFTELPM